MRRLTCWTHGAAIAWATQMAANTGRRQRVWRDPSTGWWHSAEVRA